MPRFMRHVDIPADGDWHTVDLTHPPAIAATLDDETPRFWTEPDDRIPAAPWRLRVCRTSCQLPPKARHVITTTDGSLHLFRIPAGRYDPDTTAWQLGEG